MSETTVENRICLECGVESRPGSLFCHNCGSSVSQNIDSDSTGEVWFRGDIENDKTEANVEAEAISDEQKKESTEPQDLEVIEKTEKFEISEESKISDVTDNENLSSEDLSGEDLPSEDLSSEDLSSEETEPPIIEESDIEEPEIEEPKMELSEENSVEEELSENNLKAKPIESKSAKGKKRLRSASALRRKSKSLNTKKVEVVWEERETAPNLLFIIVSMALVVLALLLFFLAMYLQ